MPDDTAQASAPGTPDSLASETAARIRRDRGAIRGHMRAHLSDATLERSLRIARACMRMVRLSPHNWHFCMQEAYAQHAVSAGMIRAEQSRRAARTGAAS